jgi:hypothetical protein
VGVGHPASIAKSFRFEPWRLSPIALHAAPPPLTSATVGVGQPAIAAAAGKRSIPCDGPPFGPSCAHGVGHPISPVSDLGRADARSRENRRPEGVSMPFQVSRHKVEPSPASRAFNLFSKDKVRATLADEPVEGWPKVALVSKPLSFACRAERLAWARSGPERTIGGDAGLSQGKGPSADSGKEVALSKSSKLVWRNVLDAPFVHYASRDLAGLDQVAKPSRAKGVNLVVKGSHRSNRAFALASPHMRGLTGIGGGILPSGLRDGICIAATLASQASLTSATEGSHLDVCGRPVRGSVTWSTTSRE